MQCAWDVDLGQACIVNNPASIHNPGLDPFSRPFFVFAKLPIGNLPFASTGRVRFLKITQYMQQ
jgi:hypothetical protein